MLRGWLASRHGRTTCAAWLWALLLIIVAIPASAHFLLNLNVRIFHVDHRSDGLTLLVRMPMPYLVADKVGPIPESGLPDPAPFTTNAMENDLLVHYVDWEQLRNNSVELGRFLADGLLLEVDGQSLSMEVLDVRVHKIDSEPGFATLEEATAVFASPIVWQGENDRTYVGDAIVDVHLDIPADGSVSQYQISSLLDPGLPGQEDTANLLVDNWPGDVKIFRARGLLTEPFEVSRSSLAAFGTFMFEGIRHILEGLDHVLFVLCLVAGAFNIVALLWRVTGFTIGHSITLSLGFLASFPQGTGSSLRLSSLSHSPSSTLLTSCFAHRTRIAARSRSLRLQASSG